MSNDTQSVVISERFGGFGLSQAATDWLAAHGFDGKAYEIPRDHPLLVQVVEELGDAASDGYANLKVVTIPAGVAWHVEEYDGFEHVAEDHRTWSSSGEETDS